MEVICEVENHGRKKGDVRDRSCRFLCAAVANDLRHPSYVHANRVEAGVLAVPVAMPTTSGLRCKSGSKRPGLLVALVLSLR
jgi:hypothetical protein